MNIPKISVIVAVYNSEKYLHRCIDSILTQTFRDFELILVDDGSIDGSGKICDEYAQKDLRVRVFHKKNEGVASARQFAIEHAYGIYSIHVDSDDWVEPNMLYELYDKAEQDKVDMLICDYYLDSKSVKYVVQRPCSLDNQTLVKELLLNLHGSLCNKLIRLSCYADNHVRFVKGLNYCEDLIVCIELLQKIKNISYISKAYYHYDQKMNSDSITRHYTYSTFLQRKFFLINLMQILDLKIYFREYMRQVILVAYEAFCHNILTSNEYKEEFGKYKFEILIGNSSLKMKIFVFLSCVGLKDVLYKIYRVLK